MGRHRQLGGWLETYPLKRNSSLVESACAEDVTGLKLCAEAADLTIQSSGRGAFCKPMKVY